MINKFILILLFLVCSIFSITCKKKINTCHYAAEPPVFFFQIKKNGQVLPDSVLSGLKLSYTINSIKKYISDLLPATDFYANKGILTSREIGTFQNQIFSLEYSNSFTSDNLFMSTLLPTPSDGCQYVLKQVKFNDLIVTGDTTFGYQPVYIFNKQ